MSSDRCLTAGGVTGPALPRGCATRSPRPAGAAGGRRAALAAAGPGAGGGAPDADDLVLVAGGGARGVRAVRGVGVVAAARSGDAAIVDLLRREGIGEGVVVTADRGLRDRV